MTAVLPRSRRRVLPLPGSLGAYAVRRLGLGVVQVLVVAVVVFLLTDRLSGDAAVVIAGDDPDPVTIAALRAELGLDRPVWVRLGEWLGGALSGDLGSSLVTGRAVTAVIADGLPVTLLLAGLTLVVLVPLSLALGMLAARREGGPADRVVTATTIGLYSLPEFALGVVLVTVFAVQLGWLPPTGIGVADPAVFVLPVVVLLARPVCSLSRLVRAGMVDALASDHVAHARRVGFSDRAVLWRHALPGALTPAVQQLARTTDWLIGGVVVVEAVFVLPGLGTALVDTITARDVPVVAGIALVLACGTVLFNLAADLLARLLNPVAS
ncbi:ABC transporter permease [Actinomycetospora corticicola]|uniref:Peptide/nickel transport system permease protein n=1 Tax=Actinomycetospora corticicola TaxID=663602 RepID=A0A7Y9J5R6_9PSEU|nr:peptide/nickel transport system permease protein [Actinomycetospora corticicola]